MLPNKIGIHYYINVQLNSRIRLKYISPFTIYDCQLTCLIPAILLLFIPFYIFIVKSSENPNIYYN